MINKIILLSLFLCALAEGQYMTKRFKPPVTTQDKHYWNKIGQEELARVLDFQLKNKPAKNVILFLGDGMSIPTITASRIYKGQKLSEVSGEEGFLTWDMFPHVGLAKTYNVDKQVPDSAGTGTAYLTGVKTNYKTLGVDATAKYKDCNSVNEDNKVFSIAKWFLESQKKVGIVTTTRITHATPACTYAHVADRDWECDAKVPEGCPDTKDIARQLVEDYPGNEFHVIMGGGYAALNSHWQPNPGEVLNHWDCFREDGKDLSIEWAHDKEGNVHFVKTKTDLDKLDLTNTDYLMGLFANGMVPYDHEIEEQKLDIPRIKDMAVAAIDVLNNDDGFFLLVEGGRIDLAHHDTLSRTALDETVAMDLAIDEVLKKVDLEETLIIVTADHAHTMMFNGYPLRGQDITGYGGIGDDDLPYMTLSYGNGVAFNETYEVIDGKVARVNLDTVDTHDWDWARPAAFPRDSETHGGDDVAIYAIGPMSHLFSGVHEQNYIAHAMAYAACVGDNKDLCDSAVIQTLYLPLLTLGLIINRLFNNI